MSGSVALCTLVGRSTSLLRQWIKFKRIQKSQTEKRRKLLSRLDSTRDFIRSSWLNADPGPINPKPEPNSGPNTTPDLGTCGAGELMVIAAMEDGLGLHTMEKSLFKRPRGVRLNTRPCLCPCAVDLLVTVLACVCLIICTAIKWCSAERDWSPVFSLAIMTVFIAGDAGLLIVAYMYHRINPRAWKCVLVAFIFLLGQQLALFTLFIVGLTNISFFIVFSPVFIGAAVFAFIYWAMKGTKKGVLILVGMIFPMILTLTLVCLKADVLFHEDSAFPKVRYVSWINALLPIWAILLWFPIVAYATDRFLRCLCVGSLDFFLKRIMNYLQ